MQTTVSPNSSRASEGDPDSLRRDPHSVSASEFEPAVKSGNVQVLSRPSLSYWQDAWLRLRSNKQAIASLAMIVALVGFTLVGPWIWPRSPSDQELARISEPPTLGRSLLVIADQGAYEDIVLPDWPETPTADGATLPAPASMTIYDGASVQSVRMKWDAVTGAAGYRVYRAISDPALDKNSGNLGVPVADLDGGNRVSYEDSFNLVPREYWYSIVAKNVDESPNHVTRTLKLEPSISLTEAQALDPGATVGGQARLSSHPAGTDYLGRDLLARLMAGARVSLFIGFFAPIFAISLGVSIGGAAGYFGGKVDEWLMRFTDFVLALPFVLFVILFKIALGIGAGDSGIFPMMMAMVLLLWTSSARVVRGQVLQLRDSEFVQASRLLGARPLYLLARHLLPNTLGVILVSLTFEIPRAIFTEAFLSFIGMGVVPPTPSWGSMCNDGIQTFLTHPHEFFFPALLISITVLAFNLLGDGLRDALDPKMRGRS